MNLMLQFVRGRIQGHSGELQKDFRHPYLQENV